MNLGIVFFVLMILYVLVGWYGYLKVLWTLSEHVHDSAWKIMPSGQIEQVKQYRKICIENKKSSFWANLMLIMPYAGIAAVFSFILLK
jgi:hypothetical protein